MNKLRSLEELLEVLFTSESTLYKGMCRAMYELFRKNITEYLIIDSFILDADPNKWKHKGEVPNKFKGKSDYMYYFERGNWVIRREYLKWLIDNLKDIK